MCMGGFGGRNGKKETYLYSQKENWKGKRKQQKISLKLDETKEVKVDITRFHRRRQNSSSH